MNPRLINQQKDILVIGGGVIGVAAAYYLTVQGRPVTPDGLPVIGRSKAIENLILAAGHGTLGMTHGLITGKLVSQIIGDERPSIDLAPLRVERFH